MHASPMVRLGKDLVLELFRRIREGPINDISQISFLENMFPPKDRYKVGCEIFPQSLMDVTDLVARPSSP